MNEMTELMDKMGYLSKESYYKLLAWFFFKGATTEECALNKKLYTDLMNAKHLCRIEGGQVPDREALAIVLQYVEDIKTKRKATN